MYKVTFQFFVPFVLFSTIILFLNLICEYFADHGHQIARDRQFRILLRHGVVRLWIPAAFPSRSKVCYRLPPFFFFNHLLIIVLLFLLRNQYFYVYIHIIQNWVFIILYLIIFPVSQFERGEINRNKLLVERTDFNFHPREFEIEGNRTFRSKFANPLKLVSPYLFPGRTIEKLGSSFATFPKCRWKFSSPFPKTTAFPSNHRCFISTYVHPLDDVSFNHLSFV